MVVVATGMVDDDAIRVWLLDGSDAADVLLSGVANNAYPTIAEIATIDVAPTTV